MSVSKFELLINEFTEFLLYQRGKGRPLALYGASSSGRRALADAKKKNIKVHYFIDKNWENLPNQIMGIPVISPEKVEKLNCIILVSSFYYNEIIDEIQHLSDCICHYYIGFWVFFDEIDEILKLYRRLADDKSRQILYDLISYFMCKNFRPVRSEFNQYFHPEFNCSDLRTVIDGGAYDGDTVKLFNTEFGPETNIIAFEPNEDLSGALKEATKNMKNVSIVQKGLWSSSGKVSFFCEGSLDTGRVSDSDTGRVSNNEDEIIEVLALDNMKELDDVDFIKFDIEGAEPFALEGARQIIERDQPNMAICLYHDWLDWVKVPALLGKILPNHRFYLGHHSNSYVETVLYAFRK